MNVVAFDPKEKEETRRKQEMLDVLSEIQRQVEQGEIKEFVACSLRADGDAQIHASCLDLVGGVGLFEVGKHLLIENDQIM
jgi:CCR4-NOT transcriptional regulation complex NOT5 subunit